MFPSSLVVTMFCVFVIVPRESTTEFMRLVCYRCIIKKEVLRDCLYSQERNRTSKNRDERWWVGFTRC